MESLELDKRDTAFIKEVERESGTRLSTCYQCGKCTAGCPAAFMFDKQVNQVMRTAQMGLKKETLSAKSLWHCLSCATCTARCPNSIDVANVMDVLRHKARDEGYINERPIEMFWRAFLDTVKITGRSYELGVMVNYMLRTGDFFSNLDIAVPALTRSKLPFLPHMSEGKSEVSRIFERYAAHKGVK